MKDIIRLAKQFRSAIEIARDSGDFDNDFSFNRFPRGCCGDTSDLLAEFLLKYGIRTEYVCGTYRDGTFENMQSHAWLLIDKHIIVDITGDQFRNNSDFLNYDKPVYIGVMDEFHRLFDVEKSDIHRFISIYELDGPALPRLDKLYKKIIQYI